MKILFVAEQFVPPVYDGSTTVYEAWLKLLQSIGEVHAIFFSLKGTPSAETHSFLRRTCRDYLILPGHAPSRALKTARALGRFANGSLFAPPRIEEFGRRPIQAAISQFISTRQPEVALISKLECVHLLGRDVLAGLRIPKLLDLHDDFVRREDLERRVLRELSEEFPALARDRYLKRTRMRHRLSRLDVARAREQEDRMLSLFDRIMISSHEEYAAYSARDGLRDRCARVPWPIDVAIEPVAPGAATEFDAGLVAAGNVFNLEGLSFFIKEVLPLIRRRRPGFRLLLVGNIAEPFSLMGLPTDGVEVAGEVRDLSTFYSRIKVCIVPLLNGTGVSLKTLEGLRHGLPVVATSKGARGLARQDLPNLYVMDAAEAMAETVLSLLEGRLRAVSRPVANQSPNEYGKRFIQLCREVGVGAEFEAASAKSG
jgi:glycosyltransferase involved in cell wall biosynthesis